MPFPNCPFQKQSILSMSGEERPPAVSAALLGHLAIKIGEDASTKGAPQKVISIKIYLKKLQILQNHFIFTTPSMYDHFYGVNKNRVYKLG